MLVRSDYEKNMRKRLGLVYFRLQEGLTDQETRTSRCLFRLFGGPKETVTTHFGRTPLSVVHPVSRVSTGRDSCVDWFVR